MTRSRRPAPRGFTIVEILVIVAIIGLLMGLLLPALGGARRRALKANESNHLRQIAGAWTSYANQNRDALLPGFLSAGTQGDWKVTYRFPDGSKIPPAPDYTFETHEDGTNTNVAGPWPWRLLPFLDYNLRAVLDHDDDVDQRVLALEDTAWPIRDAPAFGYNAMFFGGWWDKSDQPRFQAGVIYDPDLPADAPTRRIVPVSRSLAAVRRPSDLLIFTSSADRNPGIHKYNAGRDDHDGAHVVLPPIFTRYDLWGEPETIGGQGGSQDEFVSARSLGSIDAIQIYGSDEWFGETAPFG